ncbi:MAG: hypothetical protein ACPGQD_01000 [Planctomycetota bacterium]
MSSVSAVEICNLAATELGCKRIVSLTEDSPEAETFNTVYNAARRALLRSHPWSFGLTQVQLSADGTNPLFGYARRFLRPPDCLRPVTFGDIWVGQGVVGVTTRYRYDAGSPKPYALKGRYIHTDYAGPVDYEYVTDVEDTTEFDPLFVIALSCVIADMSVVDITDAPRYDAERVSRKRVETLREARRVGSIEEPPEEEEPTPLNNVRF